MPTVTLNKEVFESLVGKKLPMEELKDRISMLGTDLEKIEGNDIEVEIFPNRPDLLSEQGFARAFSSFIGVKTGLRKYEVKKSGYQVIVDESVTMRPYTACAIVKGVKFDDEKIRQIMQIQEKLAKTHGRNRKKSAYGLYPSKNIHFPVSYIAHDPGKIKFRPLGFSEEMMAIKVESRHPKGREYAHIAEGWEKYPFFIDSKGQVMCMLPYTNSEDTGKVDENTEEVFIECTGTDLENVKVALNIFTTMLADMGGEIYSIEMAYPDKKLTTPDLSPVRMKLDILYINKWLGLGLKESEAVKLLGKMGHGYDEKNKEVLIPAYRADILHQVDLAEDIAIAYGYENFTAEIPNVATIGEEDKKEKLYRKARELLIGLGLLEVKNYHLMAKEELSEKMNFKSDIDNVIIPLKNALGEYNYLRNSILPSLLKNLKDNQHNEYPQNIFEIGRTFTFTDSNVNGENVNGENVNVGAETGVEETEKLGVAICHENTDFTEAKQVLEALMHSLGKENKVKESKYHSFIEGRAGDIIIDGKIIGIIGEIHPQVLTNWSLTIPVVCAEIDVEKLFSIIKTKDLNTN